MAYLPVKPQWAPAAIAEVEKLLSQMEVVFEWGTGMSTPWLAQRCHQLFTVDDDINWSNRAKAICQELDLKNVDFSVYPYRDDRYMDQIFFFSEMGGIDIAIVDGENRVKCFEHAVKYIKRAGYIILDDSQRDEYKKCFSFKELKQIWHVGTEQKTTLFQKI